MYNSGPTVRGLITLNEKSGCKIQGLQIDGNKATYLAEFKTALEYREVAQLVCEVLKFERGNPLPLK